MKYASIMKTMMMTMFYAPLVPVIIPISMLAIFIMYWNEKYRLLRRHKRPEQMGNNLISHMIDFLTLLPLIHTVISLYK
jgi:hypothetical protein